MYDRDSPIHSSPDVPKEMSATQFYLFLMFLASPAILWIIYLLLAYRVYTRLDSRDGVASFLNFSWIVQFPYRYPEKQKLLAGQSSETKAEITKLLRMKNAGVAMILLLWVVATFVEPRFR